MFVSTKKRTHYCGDLRAEDEGQKVILMGWVNSCRNLGGLIFADLRDRQGMVQIVLNSDLEAKAIGKLEKSISPFMHRDRSHGDQTPRKESNTLGALADRKLKNEFVLAVEGVVRLRPQKMKNDAMKTGAVEVEVVDCEILSNATPPPFVIGDPNVSELMRLKYRYLSLRNPDLQRCLHLRHQVTKVVRDSLDEQGFWEVETPILYKTTPEGARDYLVPSRISRGEFYALPQSPQTLKQLLMIGGLDRYFQIARCFRDEDLRADRQPEFSQIDLEMSFVDEEDVRAINEKLTKNIWKKIKSVELGKIDVLDYDKAMDEYGTDTPDLRNPMKIVNCSELVINCGFKVFDSNLREGGVVCGLGLPVQEKPSRSQMDKWIKAMEPYGARGLVWIQKQGDEYLSSAGRFLSKDLLDSVYKKLCPQGFGVAILVSDSKSVVNASLGYLRNFLGKQYELIDKSQDKFCWIVNFPLFEYDEKEERLVACHHPFTMLKEEYIGDFMDIIDWSRNKANMSNGKKTEQTESFEKVVPRLLRMRAKAYDLVCNGHEVAGGSIRIHRPEIQRGMFHILGLEGGDFMGQKNDSRGKEDLAEQKFGYFVEALSYGTPPHGGIAWGLDRLVMILAGTDAIRDVIAYPKTTKAQCLMSGSPSQVEDHQLSELGIQAKSQNV